MDVGGPAGVVLTDRKSGLHPADRPVTENPGDGSGNGLPLPPRRRAALLDAVLDGVPDQLLLPVEVQLLQDVADVVLDRLG